VFSIPRFSSCANVTTYQLLFVAETKGIELYEAIAPNVSLAPAPSDDKHVAENQQHAAGEVFDRGANKRPATGALGQPDNRQGRMNTGDRLGCRGHRVGGLEAPAGTTAGHETIATFGTESSQREMSREISRNSVISIPHASGRPGQRRPGQAQDCSK